jgi:tetratricopeptide (TPR) repeat protein
MAEGKCDKAIEIDEALLKAHPEATAANLQSGQCYFQLNRMKNAEDALRKYIERDKSSSEALSLLGKTLLRAGRIDSAREQFNAARLADPLMIDASLGLAACFMQEQNLKAAESYLRDALALFDGATQVHLMFAECLYKQHRQQQAMEEVSRALAIDPMDKDALRMKAALATSAQADAPSD